MATLTKDGNYSWRARGTMVRDARHVHNGPEVAGAPACKKDTKRWCRGKPGREHKLAVKRYVDIKENTPQVPRLAWHDGWLVRYCAVCGREMETYCPQRRLERMVGSQWYRATGPIEPPPPTWTQAYYDEHPEQLKALTETPAR